MIRAIFWIFSAAAIGSAVLCITRKSVVASALSLVGTLCALAGIYVLLDAQFIAVLQVLVYAGAIMVLFLFVIMLLNVGRRGLPTDLKGWIGRAVAAALGLVLVLELVAVGVEAPPQEIRLPAGSVAELARTRGAVGVIAEPLFRAYLVPFEITSMLLLAAVVGAVVLAKRRL